MRIMKLITGLLLIGCVLGIYCIGNDDKCQEKNPLTVLTEKGFIVV